MSNLFDLIQRIVGTIGMRGDRRPPGDGDGRSGRPTWVITASRVFAPGSPAVGVSLALALLLAVAGQYWLAAPQLSVGALAVYALGVGLVLVLYRATQMATADAPRFGVRRLKPQDWLVGAAVAGGALVWFQMRGRPPQAEYKDIVIVWSLAIAAALLATAPWPLPPVRRCLALLRAITLTRTDWLLLGALAVAAILLRATALDLFPYIFDGDEGSQAMSAIEVLQGKLTNPFATGWYSVPVLFFFLQAGSIQLFGDSVVGVRMVSALIGALAVCCTYVLARRLFGRTTALLAATLLAVLHYHIHFSRLASVQILDTLFLVLALFLLDRAFCERRSFDAALAGIVIGLSQYFYFGSRIIPLVAVAYAVFIVVRGTGDHAVRPRSIMDALDRARPIPWIMLTAVLGYLPLFAFYMDHPHAMNERVNQVNIFANGWLAHQQQVTGKSAVELVLLQIQRAALLPFHTPPAGWYVGPAPFLGPQMAVLVAIGLLLATVSALRRAYFGLAVAYWGIVLGMALTDEAAATHRFVIAAPLLAIFAALGLYALRRISIHLVGVPRAVVGAVLAVAVVWLGAWNLEYYFLTPHQAERHGGGNGLVATSLAYYLRSVGPGYTAYFFGPPRMWYHGFNTLPFIARGAAGLDVEQPLALRAEPLPLGGPTVFAFLPERVAELEQVRAWYPSGEVREFRGPMDVLLFTTYRVDHP